MNINHHESFQRTIDESLAGDISVGREQSLREHLETCAPCQEYLTASKRVIAGLGGYSFEVNPDLHARIVASIIQARQPSRWQRAFISVAAVVLTIGGSLIDLQLGAVIAGGLDIQLQQARHALLVLLIVPSLCVLLLFPLLPLLVKPALAGKKGLYETPSVF